MNHTLVGRKSRKSERKRFLRKPVFIKQGIIKICVIYFLRIFIRLFYIFPLKNNRIIFNAYGGRKYACNPQYISEYLIKNYPGQFEVIWSFNEPGNFKFLAHDGIKLIKYASLKRFYYEATAKVSINNVGSFSWLPLRKGQEHVNTWHSGLDLVNCGMNEPQNSKLMKYSIGMGGRETTLFLAPNKLFSDYSVKVQFGYHGTILECGLPRGDDLISGEAQYIRESVRRRLNVNQDAVVIMYAPTWRYGGVGAMPRMDYLRLSAAMKKRFGDNYRIWKRLHHLSVNTKSNGDGHMLDVTNYPDIEELVIASDIIISDYSSLIWDGALRGNILLQYAPDARKYEAERGLYVPVGKWGIPAVYSMKELAQKVEKLDLDEGRANSAGLLRVMGSFETGHAAEICCAWVAEKCGITPKTDYQWEKYISINYGKPNDSIIKELRNR